jgi:hypothetical protein
VEAIGNRDLLDEQGNFKIPDNLRGAVETATDSGE